MFRFAVAAVAIAGAIAVAPSAANAEFGCTSTLCLTSSLTGSGYCSYYTATTRRCTYRFDYAAAATSTLPGNLSWSMSAPSGSDNGGCTWLTGGCSTGGTRSISGSETRSCGTTKTWYASMSTEAHDTLSSEYNYDSASVTLTAVC